VYVLECEGSTIYVGSSKNCTKRFEQHKRGDGASWTRLHKPLFMRAPFTDSRHYVYNRFACRERDEFYACVYFLGGPQNVRGWAYVQLQLSEREEQHLIREVCAHFDLCWKCGNSSHKHSACFASTVAPWMRGMRMCSDENIFIE
jgi:hypothetical protein